MSKEIDTLYDDRLLTVVKSSLTADTLITLSEETDLAPQSVFAWLTPKGAYELVDWIQENIERPGDLTTAEQIQALPTGTVFEIETARNLTFVKLFGEWYSWASNDGDDVGTARLSEGSWTMRTDAVKVVND